MSLEIFTFTFFILILLASIGILSCVQFLIEWRRYKIKNFLIEWLGYEFRILEESYTNLKGETKVEYLVQDRLLFKWVTCFSYNNVNDAEEMYEKIRNSPSSREYKKKVKESLNRKVIK